VAFFRGAGERLGAVARYVGIGYRGRELARSQVVALPVDRIIEVPSAGRFCFENLAPAKVMHHEARDVALTARGILGQPLWVRFARPTQAKNAAQLLRVVSHCLTGCAALHIAASACSRSAIRSSASSMPTERRTSVSPMPSCARTSAGTEPCVIRAGCSIRLSTPPRLSASANSRQRSRKRLASSTLPLRSAEIMPPKARICFLANACWEWLGSPG